jgi:alpha-L-rhamnosidase
MVDLAASPSASKTMLAYQATIPVGSTATIRLPRMGGQMGMVDIVALPGNVTVFGGGKYVGGIAGITGGSEDAQAVILMAGSGKYSFLVNA